MKAERSSRDGVPLETVRGEHLVPVVADSAAGPAVSAAAGQPHRVGVGRSEERFSRGRAPVDEQPTALAVREAKTSDVQGFGVVSTDDASEAQVQTEASQGTQARGQPADLHVPLQRLLAHAAGRPACGIETVGQLGDRLPEALRDGREMLLVAGNQLRIGLGHEVGGEVERAGGQGHVIRSFLEVWPTNGQANRSSTTTRTCCYPNSVGPDFGSQFCGPTRVLRQAPLCPID